MTTSKQINIAASGELVAALERECPSGTPVSTFVRGVLECVLLGPGGPLPALASSGPVAVTVDLQPVLASVGALEEHVREVHRAVQEHGEWMRDRTRQPGDAAMDAIARDSAEETVLAWERATGRIER